MERYKTYLSCDPLLASCDPSLQVFLALATNLPQLNNKEPMKVAVKQLRCKYM